MGDCPLHHQSPSPTLVCLTLQSAQAKQTSSLSNCLECQPYWVPRLNMVRRFANPQSVSCNMHTTLDIRLKMFKMGFFLCCCLHDNDRDKVYNYKLKNKLKKRIRRKFCIWTLYSVLRSKGPFKQRTVLVIVCGACVKCDPLVCPRPSAFCPPNLEHNSSC